MVDALGRKRKVQAVYVMWQCVFENYRSRYKKLPNPIYLAIIILVQHFLVVNLLRFEAHAHGKACWVRPLAIEHYCAVRIQAQQRRAAGVKMQARISSCVCVQSS